MNDLVFTSSFRPNEIDSPLSFALVVAMGSINKEKSNSLLNSHFRSAVLFPREDNTIASGRSLSVLVEERSPGHFIIHHDEPLTIRQASIAFDGLSQAIDVQPGATRFRRRGEYETIAWEPTWRQFLRNRQASMAG